MRDRDCVFYFFEQVLVVNNEAVIFVIGVAQNVCLWHKADIP
jgi:hypothetical protein